MNSLRKSVTAHGLLLVTFSDGTIALQLTALLEATGLNLNTYVTLSQQHFRTLYEWSSNTNCRMRQ